MLRVLSYYSDRRAAQLLSLELAALSHARGELIRLGLIAYQKPLYQLLSLEEEVTLREYQRPQPLRVVSEPQSRRQVAASRSKPWWKICCRKKEMLPSDRLRNLP